MEATTSREQMLTAIRVKLYEANYSLKVMVGNAQGTLNLLKVTPEQYETASTDLMVSSFASLVLSGIMEIVESSDFKKSENIIRFNSYQIHANIKTGAAEPLARAYHLVTNVLDNIITTILENN